MLQAVMPMPMLERQSDATVINAIINDEAVRPFIGGKGVLDMTALVANQDNVVLCGAHGGAIFHKLLPGLYELHTSVLRSGRGKWTLAAAKDAFFFMFTRTDCIEIVTKVPIGNLPATVGARRIGMRFDWLSATGWLQDDQDCSVPIHSLRFTDWPETCPDTLRPIGEWFHAEVQAQLAELGRPPIEHADDPFHDVVAGAVVAMIHGGQPMKAVTYYNRRAGVAKTPYIRVVSATPLELDLHDCRVRVTNQTFEVM